MKHIKKFNESELGPGGYDMEELRKGLSERRPELYNRPDDRPMGAKRLSSEFEEKADCYAKIILNSPEYMSLVDMAKDMAPGEGAVEMQQLKEGPREEIKNFISTFQDFFPSFVRPETQNLNKSGIRIVDFFRYLISKIQRPGYKL